ncbi:MAG: phosphatase PAP2 family protein [Gammaproteobacteria bacterium]|nr:phosphatase PAP2 family protein [Gammaproteobacteria bacterium]
MNLINTYFLCFCFLVLATLIIFFSRQKQDAEWKNYLLMNMLVILLGVSLFYLKSKNIIFEMLADWFPLFLIFFFYSNAGLLSRVFHDSPLDHHIIHLEKKLFGRYYPCIKLSETFNSYWLSEILHLCYFSHFLLLYGIPLYFYFNVSHAAFYQFEFAELLVFLSAFVTHAFVPVLSPRTLFEKIKAPMCNGRIYRMTHSVVESGSAHGTAFPSTHTANATLVLLVAWHTHTTFFCFVAPVALGLIISTIYGRFHYVVDMLAGIFYGSLVFMIVYL